jgi:peptide/nickel transport system substrate-binding protein
MKPYLGAFALAAPLLVSLSAAGPVAAQKTGGILKMYSPDSPASMSIHEEATVFAQRPMMGVFNNLVMFDQHEKQNSLQSIVPDLATGWSWNEDGTELTFPLRQGVKWHDGNPFTARDVACTWDMLTGKSSDKLRVNPRRSWYRNLEEITTNGDYEVTFHLKRPQPAFLTSLASGFSPVYPCHVPPRDMRQHPVGTTPALAAEVTLQPVRRYGMDGRPVQVRRIQAERVRQGDAKPRLLEEGPTLSRRHRVYHHSQPVDGGIGVRCRQVRHDFPV